MATNRVDTRGGLIASLKTASDTAPPTLSSSSASRSNASSGNSVTNSSSSLQEWIKKRKEEQNQALRQVSTRVNVWNNVAEIGARLITPNSTQTAPGAGATTTAPAVETPLPVGNANAPSTTASTTQAPSASQSVSLPEPLNIDLILQQNNIAKDSKAGKKVASAIKRLEELRTQMLAKGLPPEALSEHLRNAVKLGKNRALFISMDGNGQLQHKVITPGDFGGKSAKMAYEQFVATCNVKLKQIDHFFKTGKIKKFESDKFRVGGKNFKVTLSADGKIGTKRVKGFNLGRILTGYIAPAILTVVSGGTATALYSAAKGAFEAAKTGNLGQAFFNLASGAAGFGGAVGTIASKALTAFETVKATFQRGGSFFTKLATLAGGASAVSSGSFKSNSFSSTASKVADVANGLDVATRKGSSLADRVAGLSAVSAGVGQGSRLNRDLQKVSQGVTQVDSLVRQIDHRDIPSALQSVHHIIKSSQANAGS